MRILKTIFCIVVVLQLSKAQTDSTNSADTTSQMLKATQMAEFPGGNNAIAQYISKQLEYPEDALENDVSGTVYISFIIDTFGHVTDVEIDKTKLKQEKPVLNARGKKKGTKTVKVSGDQDYCLGTCAANIISNMPKWKPAELKGEKVKMRLRLPIRYAIY